VFDKDDFSVENVNRALELAKTNGFRCAFSNECFEIWYLLHFCFIDAGVSRTTYSDRLSNHMGRKYRKNWPRMYDTLRQYQGDAIRNAETLLDRYDQRDPARDNPSTTVHKLVLELNKYLR